MYDSTDTWSTWTGTHYYDSATSTTSAADATTVWGTWTGQVTTASTTFDLGGFDTWTVWVVDEHGRRAPVETHINDTFIQGDIVDFCEQARPQLCDVDVDDPDYADPKEKSEEVAKELLLELIGEEQAQIYEETGRLFVRGKKYDYIIQKHGFVRRIEPGKIVDLCVHLEHRHAYPDTDNVISMLFMLKHRENDVLEMANEHGEHKSVNLPMCARAA